MFTLESLRQTSLTGHLEQMSFVFAETSVLLSGEWLHQMLPSAPEAVD